MKMLRDWLARAEAIIEDVVLILLSIFVIVLAVAALSVLAMEVPPGVEARAALIAEIAQLGFLAKAEYFAMLLLPWLLIIIGLLIARELWLLRKRIESIHFEVVLHRLRAARPVRRRR
jgi:hypothetical protein